MITLAELLSLLGGEPDPTGRVPDPEARIEGPAPLGAAGEAQFTFATSSHPAAHELLRSSRAALVIAQTEVLAAFSPGELSPVVIRSDNARLEFALILQRHFMPPAPPAGIHPSAIVADGARIAPSASIGALCTIGDNVCVGDHSVLHSGVHLYPGTRIGRRVIVRAGTVIGADGYGYERDQAGVLQPFPQLGGVIVEDDVEIGSNTSIDRGALGDTVIGQRARVDNLVHVAHNVHVGADAAVIAHAMLGGSAVVGDGAWIAPCACIRDGVRVGVRAVVGLGAVVTRDVPDGQTVLGSPAREREFHQLIQDGLKQLGRRGTEPGRDGH